MQANWSLILNVLLLTGVVVALVRMLRMKRASAVPAARAPIAPSVLGASEKSNEDVIAVRKITRDIPIAQSSFSNSVTPVKPTISVSKFEDRFQSPSPSAINVSREKITSEVKPPHQPTPTIRATSVDSNLTETSDEISTVENEKSDTLMIFLLAKENRQLAGYELLQTILAAGLRFGEGHLFHRHQYPNGQGPVLCSLATATASGVFDLQNIGAFSVHGLCLFMQTSGNPTIDLERFSIMVDTAKQLSEGLNTHMLDDSRKPWSDASETRYEQRLNIEASCC